MRRMFLAVWALSTALPALAGPRPVTFCLDDGQGHPAERGMVFIWSEQLEIARDNENAFKVDDSGCAQITSVQWNGVAFPLQAWVAINYEANAPGFYASKGTVRIDKKKKKNVRTVVMERR